MDDLQQFEAFMRAYQDMVFGTAVRLLGDVAEAQDIAQEVFLKAFERFGEIGRSPTAGGWLKTVTRNLALNHLTRYRGPGGTCSPNWPPGTTRHMTRSRICLHPIWPVSIGKRMSGINGSRQGSRSCLPTSASRWCSIILRT